MSAYDDIQKQKPIELMVASALAIKCGGFIKPNKPGPDSGKDVTVFYPLAVEIKCDIKASQTGNCFFETYNSKLDAKSGLTATMAARWAHYLPHLGSVFVFPPTKMLLWLQENRRMNYVERIGDNNADGYLVAISDLACLDFVQEHKIADILNG